MFILAKHKFPHSITFSAIYIFNNAWLNILQSKALLPDFCQLVFYPDSENTLDFEWEIVVLEVFSQKHFIIIRRFVFFIILLFLQLAYYEDQKFLVTVTNVFECSSVFSNQQTDLDLQDLLCQGVFPLLLCG